MPADDLAEIEAWGNQRIDWLRGFLVIENGIPSHDSFGRVFALLDPRQFEAAFRRWVGMAIPALGVDQVVAIDGNSRRRSTNKADQNPPHVVSVFASGVGVVLGQTATDEKSNEITAIPALVATLALEDCIFTLDATVTQTDIAQANDDKFRVRTDFAANNVAIVRHVVINLVRLNTSRKASIKTKRLLAATSDRFRAELPGSDV